MKCVPVITHRTKFEIVQTHAAMCTEQFTKRVLYISYSRKVIPMKIELFGCIRACIQSFINRSQFALAMTVKVNVKETRCCSSK